MIQFRDNEAVKARSAFNGVPEKEELEIPDAQIHLNIHNLLKFWKIFCYVKLG